MCLTCRRPIRYLQQVLAAPEKKTKKADDGMTAAMRKMLQLKAAAAAAKGKSAAHLGTNGARPAPGVQVARGQGAGHQQQDRQQHAQQPAQQQQQRDATGTLVQGAKAAPLPQASTQQQQSVFQPKGLKGTKKAYLKQKKLKKKGRHMEAEMTEGEAALAAQAAASRPAFGEQAHAPLKVQLKRKHWAGEGTEKQAASRRCTAIFERQMAAARVASAAVALDDGLARQQQPQAQRQAGKKAGKKPQ